MKPAPRSLAMLGPLVLLAACSGEPKPQAGINACDLLSAEEIAGVAGGARVGAGERHDDGMLTDGDTAGAYSSTCLWMVRDEVADPARAAPQFVILQAMLWPRDKDPDTFLQSFRDAAEQGVIGHAPVPLQIGESALWWGDGVAVASNRTSIGVSAHLAEPEDRRAAAEALARIIAPRL